jgi:hypothetical protein
VLQEALISRRALAPVFKLSRSVAHPSGSRFNHNWLKWGNEFDRCKTVIAQEAGWFLIGVTIRIALMPFATHGDLILQAWLARPIAFFGKWDPYSFNANYSSALIPGYPPAFLFFQAVFVRSATLLLPDAVAFLNGMDPTQPWAGFVYSYAHIHEFLFILKLPYLAFDICTAFLLSLTVDGMRSRYAFRFWMLNPVAIFASFVFAQFDIIPTFFVALCIYFCSKRKLTSAALCLSAGAAFKLFPLMLLPLLVFGLGRTLAERTRIVLAGVLPFGIVLLPFVSSKGFVQHVLFSEMAGRTAAAGINVGQWDVFWIFVAVYTVIILHCMRSQSTSPTTIWKWFFAVLLCFYSFALFHPQWFIWIVPLAGLAYAYNRRTLDYYIILCICFFVYTFYWGAALAGQLFASICPSFFVSLPAPSQIIGAVIDPTQFVQLFRSVLTGTAVWWAFKTLSEKEPIL